MLERGSVRPVLVPAAGQDDHMAVAVAALAALLLEELKNEGSFGSGLHMGSHRR